jgi:thiosulfate/3-mercaptopyruvate sulfurtransferase
VRCAPGDRCEDGRVSAAGPLIGVDELSGLLRSVTVDPPVVLDVRWRMFGPPSAELYAGGHIPGAVAVDLDRDLAAPAGDRSRGRHPLPEPADLQAALRRAGVREGRAVVAYDDADGTIAARAWWVLRWAGVADVRVLDGGFAAWTAAGLPVTTDVPAAEPGDVVVRPGGMPVLDAAGAAGTARRGVLLDARAEPRYRGETEPVDPVAGHIPGARSAPTAGNVEADGHFLPPDRLRARFAALGVAVPDPAGGDGSTDVSVGVYCGSGVTAAQGVLALELAGVPAALYVGSWSEWVADPSRPVATGAEPG